MAILPATAADEIDHVALLTALKSLTKGDFSVRLPMSWTGMAGKVADAFNDMVEMNERLASELERLSRVVGTEGKITQRATASGLTGSWEGCIASVNALIDDLVHPTLETARVIGAVAQGDLSQSMMLDSDGRPLEGEFLRTAKVVNSMVDQLSAFASEVTRVVREVGTEGKLGGQAGVKGVAGTWKDLTDSVNSMALNLTAQVRNIADVTTAVAKGDLSKKITVDVKGEFLELKNTINTMVDQLRSFGSEVTRVAREVGTEGKLGGQAQVEGVSGTWKDLTDSVNFMASNLTSQVRNIADVTRAVAAGDLSKQISVDVQGEILELKNTVNTMVDQLSSFAAEVTRVAREVGTEGKLGGQAQVQGVSGTWRGLTENVNFMAANLTSQVRGIAKVVTAVANGDLRQKLTVEAKGEIAELANTINNMIDTLATFSDQVTTVAREVGVDGKLGGQARVPGAAGTWKDLTDNVNQLAANLTTQVRAIAEVATAVTKGELTQSIKVEAQGEVAALKDNINEMIGNLKDTTQKNSEQDWLKTNLAKFSRMLQGQKDLLTVARLILSELAPVVNAQHAVFYILKAAEEPAKLALLASYAHQRPATVADEFYLGEGLVGQCALERQKIVLGHVPPDYIRISSGLGHAAPVNIVVLPVVFEGQVKGVLELGSFDHFNPTHHAFLDQLMESIGIVINTIEANMRTEDLLTQSQSLARELQSRQEELQNTNEELQEKARLLAHQNVEVERKNQEVEQARKALEEKAEQLALTSKYKSEFLANMSHELRTPLNSLLILSDQLSRNPAGNLTPKQTEFAKTIHSSGTDLLMLINDILDLSKIESGTVAVDVGELRLADLYSYVERTFRHVAESRGLQFAVDLDPGLPKVMLTDSKRLQQVIKNLLSNAFKFTRHGRVALTIRPADVSVAEGESLGRADSLLAFAVSDTGIGIPTDKQQIIFEAFQQADGSTSRKYGGTGLGLAISREIARLLGGEIHLASAPGRGSTFTLYLPQTYAPQTSVRRVVRELVQAPEWPLAAPEERPVIEEPSRVVVNEIGDDRADIEPGDRTLLIVENDLSFARLLVDAAHESGFKALVTAFGATALTLTRQYWPSAITLDISLPDIDGWRVLERLKNDSDTRHIPVKIITTGEDIERGRALGAVSTLAKPVKTQEALTEAVDNLRLLLDTPTRDLIIVHRHGAEADELRDLLVADDVRVTMVDRLAAAFPILGSAGAVCLVVGMDLRRKEIDSLVGHIASDESGRDLPVIVHGRIALYRELQTALESSARGAAVALIASPERLLDQSSLFLHRAVGAMPERQRRVLEEIHHSNRALSGRKALIVDDDIRNIFALTAILEQHDMRIASSETGRGAIEILERSGDVDVVLMDIMMPEMDGYETMQAIRSIPRFRSLPVVAVTAKAMKGDREKCIEAGASDYVSKPVDPDELVSKLRAWLLR